MDFAREQKGKSRIVKLLDKMGGNIVKRVFFSEFFNKIKINKSKEGKSKLGVQKICKLLKLSHRFVL